MLKQFAIDELQAGMMVSRVVEQNGAVKIRKVGIIRSAEMIKGLKEMGVLRVEVDLAQSLGIEKESELTPTQLLMDNNKAVASADRNLSQQFHRAMFMPTPDTLPSKWHLYGRTISAFAGLIVLGCVLGFSLAKTPSWLASVNGLSSSSLTEAETRIASDKSTEPNASDLDFADPNDSLETEESRLSQTSTGDVSVEEKVDVQASTDVAAAEQAPLVLGYQAENPAVVDGLEQSVEPPIGAVETTPAPSISPELLAKFNAAIAELDAEAASSTTDSQTSSENYDDVPRVDQLPVALLTDLPSMSFSAHMYASTPANRWVRVNGLRMVEGDYIADQLQIVNIEPQRVILSFRENVFAMNALTDW